MENNNAPKSATKKIRLIYYNDYLLKNGIITKREHDKMYLAILSKYGEGRVTVDGWIISVNFEFSDKGKGGNG